MAHLAARPDESDAPPRPHHRGPSRVALLVAATISIMALALVVAPRLRSDGGPDREVDTYTVRLGDTISSVADLHGITPEALEEENGLTEASSLDPLSQITIPRAPPSELGLPPALATDDELLALRSAFARSASANNVPSALLEANAWQESAWDNDSVGPSGGMGISRLTRETVAFINDELVEGPALDPRRSEDNIELMAVYLDYLLDQTSGSWAASLAATRIGLAAARATVWDDVTNDEITATLTLVPDFEES